MPTPPWRRPEAQQGGDRAANGNAPDENPLDGRAGGERTAEQRTDEREERARAAGTGEADVTDVRVAGPPPAPVRQTGEFRQQPRTPEAEGEAANSTPANSTPAASAPATAPVPRQAQPHDEPPERFMDQDTAARLRERWHEVQAGFVDDPHEAVRKADEMASQALTALGESLRERWQAVEGGGDTEQLRLALRRYRDFLDHMLSI
ncbi:hypothetical protein SAMN04489712_101574 [Thermomonospora echinospora]|uniref:Uncharacterized protein n=1 Tax=Thermomonospora echinospora TaxID=1992 RepID=A0A1H5TD49_9ACTN|nr:hypothetical protein [Thermomonospora echinospora]SEF60765.1 hypothetical protein SAMN04489712_101574 [Thermomonospora echinospora]